MKNSPKTSNICPHFEECGGCNFLHGDSTYYASKTAIAANILQRLGSTGTLAEIVKIGAGQRRRVELRVQAKKGIVSIGFSRERSNQLTNISECLVTDPQIVALLPKFRTLLEQLQKPDLLDRISLTKMQNGIDLCLHCKAKLRTADIQMIAAFCAENNILRATEFSPENEQRKIFATGVAEVLFGQFGVELPANSFLQATEAAQNHITNFAISHLAGHKKIADLYCGAGTFSLPLVGAGHVVNAFEGSYDMVFALNAAIAKHGLEGSISAQQRDLYKKPVPPHELQKFDAALINPPRNGALPQIQQLAGARVPKIVMISCNPNSFERDAAHLLKNGYALKILQPIDQFFLSSHLELASVFEFLP